MSFGEMEKDFEEMVRELSGRERLEHYAIYLNPKGKMQRQDGLCVLDLECGRGEWLEVLGEKKMAAAGIDSSRHLAEECQRKGLAVICADPLQHLPHVMSMSVDVVTMLHGLGAMALGELDEILTESYRILMDGGMFMGGGVCANAFLERIPRIARRLDRAGFVQIEARAENLETRRFQEMDIRLPNMEGSLSWAEYVIIGHKPSAGADG